jgi:mannose-1-phosphate guanylyltransferase/mannose-6-phosphate isomerase
LWAIGDKDEHGNVLRGDVLIEDTRNTYVHAEHRLVSTLGVDDLVIVDTPDALLVSARENVERVKQVVARLKEKDRPQYVTHRKVFRPWGSYDSLETGPGFQVKRLTVLPGARFSLQKHRHRSEHWVVVSGTARVTCGDQEFPLQPKESTFIPAGTVHRLENSGSEMPEVIEVQTGISLPEFSKRWTVPAGINVDSFGCNGNSWSPQVTRAVPLTTTQCSDRCRCFCNEKRAPGNTVKRLT